MDHAIFSFLLPIASLLALTVLAWLASKATRLAICPICVGVSGTWLWLLAARLGGLAVDTTMLPVFLGASVVGAAHWIEARLPKERSALLWKALALPVGFIAAYGLVAQSWALAAVAAAVLASLAALFLRPSRPTAGDPAAVSQLEERMKKCC